jgi:phage FluMu gp28-like protein
MRPSATNSSAETGRALRISPLDLLLPYQLRWVQDAARFKIWLKSRQIGGSLAAAFEVVADAIENAGDWVILSAGERQALEFMEKVHRAAAIFCDAVGFTTGRNYRPEVQKSQLRFPNGARVIALPANPATARGYSANLVLDEFAFHEAPEEIWRAVYPIITNPLRGELKLRVISTPAGMNSKFYDLWSNAPDFSRHKTTVYDAVEQGLPLNLDELKANLADPDGWAQEFECQFMEHAAQVFPHDLIASVEHPDATLVCERPPFHSTFVGIDIGRRKDLTVAWTLERVRDVLWTREVLVLDGVPFPEQEATLGERVRRARYVAVDSTGLGGPISEHLAERLGEYKLDAVTFTADRKRELFSRAKKVFQAGGVRIPRDPRLRDDLASIQRIVTPQGAVKYVAARTADGHADRATALALAIHAANAIAPDAAPEPQHVRFGLRPRIHRPTRTRYRATWSS